MPESETVLTTRRLILRPFHEEDWQAVHEYASDAEVCRYMAWGPNTEEESKEFIRKASAEERQEPRVGYPFAAVLQAEAKLIGGCRIHIGSMGDREAWIGYCINRKYWGKGLGTEAAGALIRFGFEALNLHRIFATCDRENLASARVLEKSGMTREKLLRRHKREKGKWRDSFLYAILEEEFLRQR